jgi:dienelactone hydrolase
MRYLLIITTIFFSLFKLDAQTTQVVGVDSAFKNAFAPEVIYYYSDTVKLKGYVYKPEGKGPFPVYMWNHDSEKDPDFDVKLAYFWTKQGFIFFKPIRSGHSDNPGIYICNQEKQINRRREMAQLAFRQIYALHKKANNDVVAALQWIKKQPYADSTKIVVAGAGYGGIQVLITAEKDGQSSLGVKCFIAMSPASIVWNTMWGDSLVSAVAMAKRPLFIFQAHNDYKLGPCETLGPVLEKKGEPNRYKIFPDHITKGEDITDREQGHTEFFNDTEAWEKEVLKFLKDCGVKGKKK